MNNVCLIGRLGGDPEVRFSQSGTANGRVRLAIPEREKRGDEWVDVPMWVTVKAFEKTAERLAEYCHKGDEVAVTGRLAFETWQDNSGNKREAHVVIASRIDFLRKKDGTKGATTTTADPAADATPAAEPEEDLPF